MQTPRPAAPAKKFQRNVVLIGLASFFGGVSQDMFTPILPLYLANVLGLPKSFIGLTEGALTAASSVFKIIAGALADKWRRQKSLVALGYACSLVARPLLAVVAAPLGILGLRFLDGAGKGIKDAPKNALLANSTEHKTRGRSFGVTRALDTLGSVAGPIALFFLLRLFGTHPLAYRYIFILSAAPLVITIATIVVLVREPPVAAMTPTHSTLPRTFFWFLAIMAFFSLGNSSDAFLILRAQSLGIAVFAIPLVYALFNFVYAGTAIPLGGLSDRIGRGAVIYIGWAVYALAYFGFARATRAWQVWVLFAFYGMYYATTEGVAKAFVADLVPADRRGTAYGVYNMALGLTALPASFFAGFLWDHINPSAPFYFGAFIAALAAGGLYVFARVHKKINFAQ